MPSDIRGKARTSGTGGGWSTPGAFAPEDLTTQVAANLTATFGLTSAGGVNGVVNAMAGLTAAFGLTSAGFLKYPINATPAQYFASNQVLSKCPKYTLAMSFDDANTVVIYPQTHPTGEAPGGATTYPDTIANLSGRTQKIDADRAVASIGTFEFDLIDRTDTVSNGEITQEIYSNLNSGRGLRGKRVQLWGGFDGFTWAQYSLRLTYQIDDVRGGAGRYSFRASDISRAMRKDVFEADKTNLRISITAAQLHIPVASDASGFEVFEHDAGYTDAPDITCSYVKIGDEIVRTGSHPTLGNGTDALYSHPTDGQALHVLERGALGTDARAHDITTGADIARQPAIAEYVFIEGPAVKLAYAVLTGNLYGQSGKTLPTKWHLGIDTDDVRLSDFAHVGGDWWATADATKGRRRRYIDMKKTDGKRFLEKEIMLSLGAFMPIYTNGQVGIKRFVPVLSDSPYVETLDDTRVIEYGQPQHDFQSVINRMSLEWNWSHTTEKYTKETQLLDAASISTWGQAPFRNLRFRGMHTAVGTDAEISDLFATLRDRYSGPPVRLSLTCLPSTSTLEVGDPVRVNLPQIRDPNTGAGLNRVFEIQQASTDWITGLVRLQLFGSSQAAGAITTTGNVSEMDGAWYRQQGKDIATALTVVSDAVTTNGHLPAGDYYHNNDLTINAGVTVTHDGVRLFIRGNFLINGKLDGKGRGLAGGAGQAALSTPAVSGSQGYVGNTRAGTGINADNVWFGETQKVNVKRISNRDQEPVTRGLYSDTPELVLRNSAGTQLDGLPANVSGTSGGGGGAVVSARDTAPGDPELFRQAGGAGGAGGAGVVIVSRGGGFGVSGEIDVSGSDGSAGTPWSVSSIDIYPGAGAGGQAGSVYWLIDGNHSAPDLATYVTADAGTSPVPSNLHPNNSLIPTVVSTGRTGDYYTTIPAVGTGAKTHARVQYLPGREGVEEEIATVHQIAAVTGFQLQRSAADRSMIDNKATILAPVTATWTATTDPDFDAYELQMRRAGTSNWRTMAIIRESTTTERVEHIAEGEKWEGRMRIISARGADGHSDWTETVSFTMDFSAPGLFKEYHRIVATVQNELGRSVAIDRSGLYALVGAPEHSTAGGANLYGKRGEWEVINSTIEETSTSDYGHHVAISQYATRFAVSDANYDSLKGRVWTYHYAAGAAFSSNTVLTGSGPSAKFGQSIALNLDDGTVLAVGSPGHTNGAVNDGRLQIFTRSGDTWSTDATFDGPASAADSFGHVVAISADGSTVAALARDEGTNGVLHIYRKSGSWTERDTYTVPTARTTSARDSLTISDDGSWIAVGGSSTGEVTILEEQTTDIWTQVKELEGTSSFGHSLAFGPGNTPTRLAVGEYGTGSYNGQVVLYEKNDEGDWLTIQTVVQTESDANADFGRAVDMNHDTMLVGASQGTTRPQISFHEAVNINE